MIVLIRENFLPYYRRGMKISLFLFLKIMRAN